jgi:outer membrane protein W
MKNTMMTIALTTGALATGSLASADALAMLNQADEKAASTPDSVAAATETQASSPWYAAAAIGGNMALDSKLKDGDGAKFKFKTGVGLNVGVGYTVAENLAVEVRSGLLWNQIDKAEGLGATVGTLSGGKGAVYQVPVMASLVYSIPISDKFSIGLKGGAGVQFTNFRADDVAVTLRNGDKAMLKWDNNSTAFRWEVGFQLAHQVADNIKIGGGVLFSGTSEVNIGSSEIAGNPGNIGLDQKLKGLYNVSLGFGITVAF